MDLFAREDLTALIEQPRTTCVSLYLPTHRAGPRSQQDPIRLANLIRAAERDLANAGTGARETGELLAHAHVLAADTEFWRRAADGVAAFFRAGWSRVYRLPLAFDELAVVSDRFHVLPLLPLLAGDGRYFLLAVSEHEARLMAGTRRGLRAVAVPDMPYGVRDALRQDRREVRGDHLVPYLRVVDRAVSRVLRGHDAPLVVAGVEHVRAAYREITSYPHVLRAGVPGSPDHVSAADLHRRAWPLVAATFTRDRTAAAAAYADALGTGLTTDDLDELAAAAREDRVGVLFVPVRVPSAHRAPVEAAAVDTIRAGGTVYVVPADDMPGPGPVAGILRH